MFSAADHELTDDYLADKIAGRPIASKFINHADVYSAVPDELVSGLRCVRDRDDNEACYIISSVRFAGKKKNRKLRTIDGDPAKSYWHSEKGKIPLERRPEATCRTWCRRSRARAAATRGRGGA